MGLFDFWKRMVSPQPEEERPMMIACSFCKNKFAMEQMQYDKSGENLACISCAMKPQPPKPLPQLPQKFGSKQYVPPGYEDKNPFICSDCGYKFSRHGSYKAKMRCSYCSSGNIRPYVATQAQDILNHVDNPERLFKY